eukprot:PhF_6_TR25646/c0_g1_i2/m.36092
MCGIGALLGACSTPEEQHEIIRAIMEVLQRRGPDSQQVVHPTPECAIMASVLSMRGSYVVPQPVTAKLPGGRNTDIVFAWNGEVFGGSSVVVSPAEGDTMRVLEELTKALSSANSYDAAVAATRVVLEGIEGPYAFILYIPDLKCVLFGRDPLGRRSLLKSTNGDGTKNSFFALTSVSPRITTLQLEEVEVNGFFGFHFDDRSVTECVWSHRRI